MTGADVAVLAERSPSPARHGVTGVRTVDDRAEWNAIVGDFPGADVEQSWEWGVLRPRLGWPALRLAAFAGAECVERGDGVAAHPLGDRAGCTGIDFGPCANEGIARFKRQLGCEERLDAPYHDVALRRLRYRIVRAVERSVLPTLRPWLVRLHRAASRVTAGSACARVGVAAGEPT